MGEHERRVENTDQIHAWDDDRDTATEPTGEPVVIAHAITVILGALVTAGWVTIPSTTIDTIGTVVALALSTVAAVMARARVSPLKGGIWSAIEGFVVDKIREELDAYSSEPPQ